MSVHFKKSFFPVVHCVGPNNKHNLNCALRNVGIAKDNGADGVFLVGDGVNFIELHEFYEYIRLRFQDFWIGINFKDLNSQKNCDRLSSMVNHCSILNGVFIDGFIPDNRLKILPHTKVFVSLGFSLGNSYSTNEITNICNQAVQYADVVTVRGDEVYSRLGIGLLNMIQCLTERISLALVNIGDKNNVSTLLGHFNTFIVDSISLEKLPELGNDEYLVWDEVRELADLIHG